MLTTHTTIEDIKSILRSQGSYKYEDKSYFLECNTTQDSAVLSNIETENIVVGAGISGDGIPKFTTVLSIDDEAHTVTMSASATATGTNIIVTFLISANAAFQAQIIKAYDPVQYEEMYPIIGETKYTYINNEVTDLDDDLSYRLIVLAERYLIAAEFLNFLGDSEFENRQTEREFKIQSGIGTSISGRPGKQYVADKLHRRGFELLELAGHKVNYSIGIY